MRISPENQFDFNVYDVLTICGVHPTRRPTRKGEVDVECPHGVKSSKGKRITFGVNIQYGTFKCFGECSDCVGKGGMLDLYNLLKGRLSGDRKGALKEIREAMGHSGYKRQEAYCRKQVPQASVLDAEKLDFVYRAMLQELTLNKEHYDSLIARGLTDECIQKGLFRSIPHNWNTVIQRLSQNKVQLIGVPGFYQEGGKVKCTARNSGFFIPYFTAEGKIAGLQIRFDTVKADAQGKPKGKRYMWFSSAGYTDGCAASNTASYGIPGYMDNPSNRRAVFITEGALKAYVANTLDEYRHPFIAIAGVSCFNQWRSVCEYLQQKNIRLVVDAFDSDRATNAQVKRSLDKLRKIASEYGITMKRLDWGTEQKGVDDFLLHCRNTKGVSKLSIPGVVLPPVPIPTKKVSEKATEKAPEKVSEPSPEVVVLKKKYLPPKIKPAKTTPVA